MSPHFSLLSGSFLLSRDIVVILGLFVISGLFFACFPQKIGITVFIET
jgi:hypothetical protein